MNEKTNEEKDLNILIEQADNIIENTIRKVNYELVNMYWNIGKMIVKYQKRNNSKYGEQVVKRFSDKLLTKYGRGFSLTNIKTSINLFKYFEKSQPADFFRNISWSHYQEVINSNDKKKINFYLNEAEKKNLTILELRNLVRTKAYERTLITQKSGVITNNIEKILKDPVILNIKEKVKTERELENEIIANIFDFMKEIGNLISLFGRQYKIKVNGLIYKVDLVFYDKENRSFILIDLKINKITQKDVSQMQFYLKFFNENVKDVIDNNTVGIILVETKDFRIENYTDIYQIKYLSEMPKEKELLKIIKENKIILLKTEKLKINKQK